MKNELLKFFSPDATGGAAQPQPTDDPVEPDDEGLADDDELEVPVDEGGDEEAPQPQQTASNRKDAVKAMRQKLKAEEKSRKEMEEALDRLAKLGGMDRKTLLERLRMAETLQAPAVPGTNPFLGAASPAALPTAPAPTTTPQATFDPNAWAATNAYSMARQVQQELEIQALKQDPFYADIDEKKQTVLQMANQMGISVKAAYLSLYGEERAKQVAREAEQRALENARKRSGLMAESDFGVNAPEKLGLSDEEYRIAQQLGLDPRTYAKLKTAQGYDDYKKAVKQRG